MCIVWDGQKWFQLNSAFQSDNCAHKNYSEMNVFLRNYRVNRMLQSHDALCEFINWIWHLLEVINKSAPTHIRQTTFDDKRIKVNRKPGKYWKPKTSAMIMRAVAEIVTYVLISHAYQNEMRIKFLSDRPSTFQYSIHAFMPSSLSSRHFSLIHVFTVLHEFFLLKPAKSICCFNNFQLFGYICIFCPLSPFSYLIISYNGRCQRRMSSLRFWLIA